MVNYIDKKIISLVIEIIFMIVVLISTYFIWGNIDLSKYATIASGYSTNQDSLLVSYEDNGNSVSLNVKNNGTTNKEYILYMGIKDEDIDQNMVIKYLDSITSLDSFSKYKNNNITYYLLDNSTLNNNESKNYNITLYNNLEFTFNIEEM